MSDYAPVYKPGQAITLAASADVTAGRVLEVSGAGTVAHAAADSVKVVGVAAFDAKNGENVTVLVGGVHRLTAAGAVTAGDRVAAAATGKVATAATPATGAQLGLALTTAADGATVEVAWNQA